MSHDNKQSDDNLYTCPLQRGLCDTHAFGAFEAKALVAGKKVDLSCGQVTLKPEEVDAVVYHGGCPDGFTSALIARYALNPFIEAGQDVRFYPVSHSERDALIPCLKGCKVLFIDIGPSPALLDSLTEQYAILDHHATTEQDSAAVPDCCKVFRSDYAGCHLAWAYFYPQYPFPYLFRAIEARDLWTKDTIEDCDALLSGLHTLCGWCPCCWWEASQSDSAVQRLLHTGTILHEDRMRRVKTFCQKASAREKEGHRVWLMNINDLSCVSDAGHQVLALKKDRHQDISLSFRYDVKRQVYAVSLRSLVGGPHVGKLAKKWNNGGGHKHAAGFEWSHPSIESLFQSEVEVPGQKRRRITDSPLMQCNLQ